jgi:hypothetical protein
MYVRSTVTPPVGRVARARKSAPPETVARVGWFSTALRAGPGMALFVWWLAYQVQYTLQTGEVTDASAAAVATTTNTRDGSTIGVLLVGTFAAIGVCYTPRAVRVLRSHSARVVLGLLGAYLIWALLSYTWTVDPSLTVRRWGQFALVVAGSVGLGLGWYGSVRDGGAIFARHIAIAAVASMGSLLILIGQSGSINVFDPDWAAKSFGVGTPIAYPIAFGALAGVWLWSRGLLSSWWAAPFLGLCLVSILAVKGRFLTLDMLIFLPVCALSEPHFSWRKTLLVVSVVGVAAYGVALASAIVERKCFKISWTPCGVTRHLARALRAASIRSMGARRYGTCCLNMWVNVRGWATASAPSGTLTRCSLSGVASPGIHPLVTMATLTRRLAQA